MTIVAHFQTRHYDKVFLETTEQEGVFDLLIRTAGDDEVTIRLVAEDARQLATLVGVATPEEMGTLEALRAGRVKVTPVPRFPSSVPLT